MTLRGAGWINGVILEGGQVLSKLYGKFEGLGRARSEAIQPDSASASSGRAVEWVGERLNPLARPGIAGPAPFSQEPFGLQTG